MSILNFGMALEALKKGERLTHSSWLKEGEKPYIYLLSFGCEDFHYSKYEKNPSAYCRAICKSGAGDELIIGWYPNYTEMLEGGWHQWESVSNFNKSELEEINYV